MKFNFKSLTRSDRIGYIYNSETASTPSYLYRNPMAYVSSNIYEYLTYGNGNIQHSPEGLVAAEHYMDAMSSLASYLLNDLKCAEAFANDHFIHPLTNKDEVQFLASLKFNENKPVYYSLNERKKTSAKSKEHDKRYEPVPKDADGSGKFIFNTLRRNYFSMLKCIQLIEEIRDHANYCWFDFEKILQTKIDWANLTNPIHVIQAIIQSFRQIDYARRSFSCLENNWISRQSKKEG